MNIEKLDENDPLYQPHIQWAIIGASSPKEAFQIGKEEHRFLERKKRYFVCRGREDGAPASLSDIRTMLYHSAFPFTSKTLCNCVILNTNQFFFFHVLEYPHVTQLKRVVREWEQGTFNKDTIESIKHFLKVQERLK